MRSELRDGAGWGETNVILENLVDLGTNVTQDLERNNPTLVIPREEFRSMLPTNPPPPPPDLQTTNMAGQTNNARRPFPWRRPGRNGRPEGMSQAEYDSLIQRKGAHSFIIVMSNQTLRTRSRQDFWLRSLIVVLASVSMMGLGLAWRNLDRNSELQIRLVRASEANSHLKQMNLAAAGLAHETRNPLNIIRGLAQMIARQEDASSGIRQQCRAMIDETDRVTAQLNEFMQYSRPRDIRYAEVSLKSVVAEVARTLGGDLEEKSILLRGLEEDVVVKADEALIRQALFNLVINAIQAVEPKGEIQVTAFGTGGMEAALEIRDNGPGVPPEQRGEIFKPYFTTHKKGTGLGLAVVHQIVLAHGWEISYLPNELRGAIFRISHLKLASPARANA
jgi:signal transduction histidine kinase